ncbi:uncharacterized protein BDR25DRAFT_344263 [Lindgomyces ingoldianus]|uniref:Uncharacterized protein n=1 Tax=Lindgomyces ingoldianus TaxID=673940 RepID=A0ACB6QNQ1_9PLEO|nr:uncharacterized protein BDR25DRAFT_344263 [Lindgomyces ingoldianus]KAF2468541.1 hypothetical protein BDR25DRAFT_344263 [Lindgomyces ingoldianus]
MVLSTSKFETFSVRPPTPPKDLDKEVNEALEFLDDPFGTKLLLNRISTSKSHLSTPAQSPSSETANSTNSSSRKKRVNFEIPTCTLPATSLAPHHWTPLHSSPLRPLPQTRVSRPLKSILKAHDPASTPPTTDEGSVAHKFETLADMLESMVKMLAQGSRSSKLDAYITLQRTMQAYEKVPDIQSLTIKMGLLSQFIRRDMQAMSMTGSGPDSQLIGQAIKFLMVLVRIADLKTAMDDGFCSFIVERCIQVAADASMPKTIINTHLALLMQQNFRPKIMTTVRVEKILDVFDNINDRVSGFSVLAYRIRVYRKLIQQRPEVMAKHTDRWFKHTLQALLSCQKDINQSALDTAMSAAKTIGSDPQVTKAVLSILNRVKTDGNTLGKVIAQELDKMLGSEVAPLVPQIWGVVTAFLRDSFDLNKFTAMSDWLALLQKFFKSDNDMVKVNANVATNFLIYAVNITQSSPRSWSELLLKIPQQQLQRRSHWKKAEGEVVTASYLALLYYGLRPTASYEQLDRYWNEFVADFWKPLIHSSSSKYAVVSCRIVSSLLNGSRKAWDEQRVLELKSQSMVQRDELPLLDPKWVRKNLSSILKFVETLLDATPWLLETEENQPAKTVWISLLDSLVEASSKEVMASTETKDALAHIVNLLRRIWDRHTSELAIAHQKEVSWANKFCFLIEKVLEKLGTFQFADKCLTRNEENGLELAGTPSNRSRQNGPRISPLLYFVDLLVSRSEGKLSDKVRFQAVQLILEPCVNARNTRLGKLELLRDCSAAVDSSSKNAVTLNFWARIANQTKACIQERSSDANERQSQQLGKEYEVLVEILALGSKFLLGSPSGRELLTSFVEAVRREAGEGAVVLAVIEKVSERVLRHTEDSSVCLPYATTLLQNLPKTIVRRNLDQGRQSLWPSSQIPARGHEFNPYNHFYAAIVSIGSASYQTVHVGDSESVREFFSALANSIQQCPLSYLAVYLRSIQVGITPWIEDADRKLQGKEQSAKHLYREVLNLWQAVNTALERLPRKDSSMLVVLEPLVTAGFSSRRLSIVNISITTWNATFGKEESLRYPSRLENILRRFHSTVNISLPSLSLKDEDVHETPSFYDSDSQIVDSERGFRSPRIKDSPFEIVKTIRSSRSPAVPSTSTRRMSSRHTPKVRLRHENSQIQFEPIVSSPTDPLNQESQILTERQIEMIERQRGTAHIFSDVASVSDPQPQENATREPSMEFHSDLTRVDDLPSENSRTPLKSLASMGPMDVYLGSSPTPQARNRSQQVLRDDTNMATPNAVRTVRLANDTDDLGSSPPRFESQLRPSTRVSNSNDKSDDLVRDSFDYHQPEQFEDDHSMITDEEETVDEGLLLHVGRPMDQNEVDSSEDELPTDEDPPEVPSSTVDLQLTAQLTAELNAQIESTVGKDSGTLSGTLQEPNNLYVDALSQNLHPDTIEHKDVAAHPLGAPEESLDSDNEPANAAEGEDTQKEAGTISSGTSRVGDSFLSMEAAKEPTELPDTQVESRRRSSRTSVLSSPRRHGGTKRRKQSTADSMRKSKKSKTTEAVELLQTLPESSKENPDDDDDDDDDDGILDCIVVHVKPTSNPLIKPEPSSAVSSPASRKIEKKGDAHNLKKSRWSTQELPDSQVVMLASASRKRPAPRSMPAPAQVEAHSADILVENTPAPKRARKSLSQDVGTAKATASTDSSSQVKRLSHVQVTPKRAPPQSASSAAGSSRPTVVEENDITIDHAPIQSDEASVLVGEQNTDVARQSDTTAPLKTEQPQSQHGSESVATPNRSFTERVILTPRSVLGRLRKIISDCSQMVLGRADEREFDDVLFDLRRQVHAAGRRSEEGQ